MANDYVRIKTTMSPKTAEALQHNITGFLSKYPAQMTIVDEYGQLADPVFNQAAATATGTLFGRSLKNMRYAITKHGSKYAGVYPASWLEIMKVLQGMSTTFSSPEEVKQYFMHNGSDMRNSNGTYEMFIENMEFVCDYVIRVSTHEPADGEVVRIAAFFKDEIMRPKRHR